MKSLRRLAADHPKMSAWALASLAMAVAFLCAARAVAMTGLQRLLGCILMATVAAVYVWLSFMSDTSS